ncbi:MAG: hypothetical protein ABIR78_11195 [Ferruginibacter sp.]
MISKLHTAVALITVAAFVSCAGNDNNDYIDKSIIPTASEKTTTQAAAVNTTTANTIPANTPVIPGASTASYNPQQANLVNAVPQTTAATTTAPGMNPPHGQPGHRCDIAVGAPLNSKPAPVTAQPVALNTAQQQAVTMTPVPTQTKTAPGMNPPHGEPNHRCDIAVGAPLNSKPAPTNAQPVALNTSQQPGVTMTQVPTPTKTAPGMNPPHGEPNHRCDIAVGAPLNSKPAPTNAQPLVTTTQVPTQTKTAPGMNPPHGEPNHRCDIAVGAPLNSKPVPTTVQTTAPPALLVPTKADSTKN